MQPEGARGNIREKGERDRQIEGCQANYSRDQWLRALCLSFLAGIFITRGLTADKCTWSAALATLKRLTASRERYIVTSESYCQAADKDLQRILESCRHRVSSD